MDEWAWFDGSSKCVGFRKGCRSKQQASHTPRSETLNNGPDATLAGAVCGIGVLRHHRTIKSPERLGNPFGRLKNRQVTRTMHASSLAFGILGTRMTSPSYNSEEGRDADSRLKYA